MPFGLFGKKAEVELTTDKAVYAAGEQIRARVHVRVLKDFDIRGGSVALQYAHKYLYTDDDDDIETHTMTITVQTADFVPEGRLTKGTESTYDVTLTVPPEGPPTGVATGTGVVWEVQATLSDARALASNPSAETVIRVQTPADLYASWVEKSQSNNADCGIDLEVAPTLAAPGTPLRGSVSVTPQKDLDVHAIKVSLEQVERGLDDTKRVRAIGQVQVSDRTTLPGGTSQTYDWELTVPENATPTLAGPKGSLHWYVLANVERGLLHHDHQARYQIVVYQAPLEDQGTSVETHATIGA